MQADVILKEPPPWMPPSASQGGGTRRGGRGGAAPPRTPLSWNPFISLSFVKNLEIVFRHKYIFSVNKTCPELNWIFKYEV